MLNLFSSPGQKSVAEKTMGITLKAIEEMYMTLRPKGLAIADLGCSSGSNALSYIRKIADTITKTAENIGEEASPEIEVCLNDLPTNDFNTLFEALPEFYSELKKGRSNSLSSSIFVAAYPGSFYDKLFPENSLHFVYSFNCLHWLSKVRAFNFFLSLLIFLMLKLNNYLGNL